LLNNKGEEIAEILSIDGNNIKFDKNGVFEIIPTKSKELDINRAAKYDIYKGINIRDVLDISLGKKFDFKIEEKVSVQSKTIIKGPEVNLKDKLDKKFLDSLLDIEKRSKKYKDTMQKEIEFLKEALNHQDVNLREITKEIETLNKEIEAAKKENNSYIDLIVALSKKTEEYEKIKKDVLEQIKKLEETSETLKNIVQDFNELKDKRLHSYTVVDNYMSSGFRRIEVIDNSLKNDVIFSPDFIETLEKKALEIKNWNNLSATQKGKWVSDTINKTVNNYKTLKLIWNKLNQNTKNKFKNAYINYIKSSEELKKLEKFFKEPAVDVLKKKGLIKDIEKTANKIQRYLEEMNSIYSDQMALAILMEISISKKMAEDKYKEVTSKYQDEIETINSLIEYIESVKTEENNVKVQLANIIEIEESSKVIVQAINKEMKTYKNASIDTKPVYYTGIVDKAKALAKKILEVVKSLRSISPSINMGSLSAEKSYIDAISKYLNNANKRLDVISNFLGKEKHSTSELKRKKQEFAKIALQVEKLGDELPNLMVKMSTQINFIKDVYFKHNGEDLIDNLIKDLKNKYPKDANKFVDMYSALGFKNIGFSKNKLNPYSITSRQIEEAYAKIAKNKLKKPWEKYVAKRSRDILLSPENKNYYDSYLKLLVSGREVQFRDILADRYYNNFDIYVEKYPGNSYTSNNLYKVFGLTNVGYKKGQKAPGKVTIAELRKIHNEIRSDKSKALELEKYAVRQAFNILGNPQSKLYYDSYFKVLETGKDIYIKRLKVSDAVKKKADQLLSDIVNLDILQSDLMQKIRFIRTKIK
jgi:hypothetical protein